MSSSSRVKAVPDDSGDYTLSDASSSDVRPRRTAAKRRAIQDDDDEDDGYDPESQATTPPSVGSEAKEEPSDGQEKEHAYGRNPIVLIDRIPQSSPQRLHFSQQSSSWRFEKNTSSQSSKGKAKQTSLAFFFGKPKAAVAAKVKTKVASPKKAASQIAGPSRPFSAAKCRKSDEDAGSDFVVSDSSEDDDDVVAEIEDSEEADADEEDEDKYVSSEEEDTPKRSAKSSASAAGKAAYGKRGVWEPSFRAGKAVKQLPFVPSLAKALAHEKEARAKEIRGDYPPISDLGDIFADIVQRTPAIPELAKALHGKPLRVATMCSGTESPLLALNLISRAVKDQHGMRIDVHHVFSCEIEPYKQAYIERNFAPPILFRDVCELGDDMAHTAYGSLVEVPGDVDLLVAGTSCVDYSNLNNKKKGVDEGGESGRTFFGMLKWVERHRPPIVILENVKSAPWGAVGTFFENIGYDAAWSNTFDTKNYYIPHTRQRGYLIATANRKASYAGNWEALTRSLARPASSSLEAFLLPPDDPRLNRVRTQFARDEGGGKGRSTIDWSKCQSRHERARDEESLGNARPFTAWEEGGSCRLSHDAWNEWAVPQPERVLDLLDITIIRAAKEGFDPHYKSRVWELSQNVDRNIASARPGICMCLTPSGMPYVTNRGGPLVGLEALSLQGLPIDELILTRENNDQLQNLAGNAMSSTVIGTCVLAALVIARQDLEDRRKDVELLKTKVVQEGDNDEHVETRDGEAGTQMVGNPKQRDYDVVTCEPIPVSELLRDAHASSQRCACEGREGMVDDVVYRCASCHHSACARCKSRPTHDYVEDTSERQAPAGFAKTLKRALPMRFMLGGITYDELTTLITGSGASKRKEHKAWAKRVSDVLSDGIELHFSELLRQKVWLACFTAADARLELCLDPKHPHWRLFIEPASDVPAGSELRTLLAQPVARLQLNKSLASKSALFDGEWQVCLPVTSTVHSSFRFHAERVPTWEAAMGIGGKIAGQKRFSRLDVNIDAKDARDLDADIRGSYKLLANCATANGALHVRENADEDVDMGEDLVSDSLFFFLDPDRYKDQKCDKYVFSNDIDKLPFPLERVTIAKTPEGWTPKRPARADQDEVVDAIQLTIEGRWVGALSLKIINPAQFTARLGVMKSHFEELPSCDRAVTLASCSAQVQGVAQRQWPKTEDIWQEIDLEHHAIRTFRDLAWLTERVHLPSSLASWQPSPLEHERCSRCAPQPPSIQWLQVKGKAAVPVENEREAGPYEQLLKRRPNSFVVQLMRKGDEARLRIGVNPLTLMHRAFARLPTSSTVVGEPDTAWRVTLADRSLELYNLPKYSLRSNRQDPEAATPSIFKLELRKEQKRSLHWMLAQEDSDAEPFLEEEVAEGTLGPLQWRVEGRATRQVMVRGGVLADAVGYGKTCITLALVAAAKQRAEKLLADTKTQAPHIATGATLVIVPPHLCKQWESEVRKFCGSKLNVIVIYGKNNLNGISIREIIDADIVIMSVTVYKSDAYFESMSHFAAANRLPLKPGRYFDAALQCSLRGLRNRVRELHSEGAGKVYESVKQQVDYDPTQYTDFKKSKRLVGQAYADAHKDKHGKKFESVAADSSDEEWVKPTSEKLGVGSDIWGLKSTGARKDWRELRALPLEAFKWTRVVIDEFHYVAENADRAYSAIRELEAEATWILSGTPPTADFADVKSIASFLKVHLGIDDDQDSIKASVRTRRDRARTKAEQFRNYVEVHSAEWHHRRQAVGQRFLDRFVRQNIAEIDEIDSQVHLRPIRMPAAERACYLELAHMIEALDLRHARRLFKTSSKISSSTDTKAKKKGEADSGNDRDDRLRKTLGESSSPEEALSRQASHFVLADDDGAQLANAMEACEYIVAERQRQRDECFAQMERDLTKAMQQHFVVLLKRRFRDDNSQALVTFANNVENGAWGDNECKPILSKLLRRLECTRDGLSRKAGKVKYPQWKQAKEDKEADWLEERKLRDMVHMLQRLRNEYWNREQSLRYFQAVRDIQRARSDLEAAGDLDIRCPSPKCALRNRRLTLDEIALASTCGHAGCRTCIVREAYIGKCCTEQCFALAKPTSVVYASSLGHEADASTAYGIKLATVATLLKTRIPQDERVLVFVQFEGLLRRVAEAFDEYGIDHVRLRGSASARSTQLDDFQNGNQRVLLLSIADESAAGSNLTVANHVVFLSPLITEEAQQYHATMEQARGRAVRFGQLRKVHIWRFAVRDTIDQSVLETRESTRLEDIAELDEDEDEHMQLIDVRKRKSATRPRVSSSNSSPSKRARISID